VSASSAPAPSASVVDGRSVAARRRKAAASRRVVNSGSLWMSAEYQRKVGWSAAAAPVASAIPRRRKIRAERRARRGATNDPAAAVAIFARATESGRPKVVTARKNG
jgi:hypothetical protein